MKKLLYIGLITVGALGFTACGGENKSAETDANETVVEKDTVSAEYKVEEKVVETDTTTRTTTVEADSTDKK